MNIASDSFLDDLMSEVLAVDTRHNTPHHHATFYPARCAHTQVHQRAFVGSIQLSSYAKLLGAPCCVRLKISGNYAAPACHRLPGVICCLQAHQLKWTPAETDTISLLPQTAMELEAEALECLEAGADDSASNMLYDTRTLRELAFSLSSGMHSGTVGLTYVGHLCKSVDSLGFSTRATLIQPGTCVTERDLERPGCMSREIRFARVQMSGSTSAKSLSVYLGLSGLLGFRAAAWSLSWCIPFVTAGHAADYDAIGMGYGL